MSFLSHFHPTENILASGGGDATVKLWNAIAGTEILTIERTEIISAVAFFTGWKDTRLDRAFFGYDSFMGRNNTVDRCGL